MPVKKPKEWFEEHVKTGGAIESDYSHNGARQVTFKDGGKVVLLASGHFIHKWANGKQVQCNPDGTNITVIKPPLSLFAKHACTAFAVYGNIVFTKATTTRLK